MYISTAIFQCVSSKWHSIC